MKKIILATLLVTVVSFFNLRSSSIAEDVILCVSETDQYVAMVNNKGDCLENENQIVFQKVENNSSNPVANFMNDENCDGEGTITEIGLDTNGNGALDADEMVAKIGSCAPAEVEEDELASENNES